VLRTVFMTARALYFPETYIGQTDRQIIIRYKDKLDTEVLCSLRMRTGTSSWALTLESADGVHTACSEISRVEDRDFFITARSHLTERQAGGDHNAICKYAHLCLSYDVLIQLNDFNEIWYECRSITDVTNFSVDVTASQTTRTLVWMSQHHRCHEIHTLFLAVCNTNTGVRICAAWVLFSKYCIQICSMH
jgi:hypothetical protein